jgi:hypothetical protein
MSQTDQTQIPVQEPADPEADGYYGDDDVSSEELDLSFLDQDDDDQKPAAPAQK